MRHSLLQTCHITIYKCSYKPTFESHLILEGTSLSLNSKALWKMTFYKSVFMDENQLVCGSFRIPSTCIKRVKAYDIKSLKGAERAKQSANNNARGGGGANLFLNTPYLCHLGLHPGGFERRHGLLCCSWAVKIHKAIAWREKRRAGERRGRVKRKKDGH